MQPLVSVIIPVYNAEKYLIQCIDSVVNQTLRDIEIVLIDDGSTDGSGDICKRYLSDPRVSYFYKENEGLAAARQDGIDRSTGEYIGFVDSDDWCEPDMFVKMYTAAKSNDSDVVFCNCYENIDKKNKKFLRSGTYDRKQLEEEVFPHILMGISETGGRSNTRWSNCLRIYKRALLEAHQIRFCRNFRRSQDLQLTFEATMHAQHFYYLGDDYLYHNRQDPGSLSRGYTKNMWQVIQPLIEKLRADADAYDGYDFKKYMVTTTFFFVSDVIYNELKPDAPGFFHNVRSINEVVRAPICDGLADQIDGSHFNCFYRPVYRCIRTRNGFDFMLRYKVKHSRIYKRFFQQKQKNRKA